MDLFLRFLVCSTVCVFILVEVSLQYFVIMMISKYSSV